MPLLELLALLGPPDLAALALTFCIWAVLGWRIEHPGRRPSVGRLMAGYQRDWLREVARRENRIFDAQIAGNLRQGTAFFASTALLAVGGTLALIGSPEPLQGVAEELVADRPVLLWQLKLVPPAAFLIAAFLRFVWSHRLYGYFSVVLASVPDAGRGPTAEARAGKAAELLVRATLNFNRGLRAMYFALGTLGWLVGPAALAVTTLLVTWVLWSREFASHPHAILSRPDAPS